MDSFPIPRNSPRQPAQESGYVLLTLLLMVSMLVIAAAAILPTVSFELRRDREEEMIHRGVQYSRAIRTYYKKFGRYPARLEDLENTNNLRFLRKRYKDPITGKDFKILHFGEVKMTFSTPMGGASNLNGANSLNASGALNPSGGGGFSSPVGGPAGGFNSQSSGFGATSQIPPGTTASTPPEDPNQPADSKDANQQPGQQSGSGDQLSTQTFGGMPIVGVVSISKKDGIREFNHKKKYSEWQFIYDPASDRGGLLSTPNQPPPMGFGNQAGQPGQPGQSMGPGSPNNSPFGQQPGAGNNPNPTSPFTPSNPMQPPATPPEQPQQ